MFNFQYLLLIFSPLLVNIASAARFGTVTHDETFTPDAILRVASQNISQSCIPAKATALVNGTSPGPEIRLVEGNTYWIRVWNDMVDANLTMHWHGLSMAVSPFSDGTPAASQWPIPPAHFFDYEIAIPLGMAGTYMYHSHVGFQAVSAMGAIIISEAPPNCPPYAYDEERTIILQDVFSRNDSSIEAGLVAAPFVFSGETGMLLVNGKGGGTENGTVCNAELTVIDVEPGKTYRLRFIGATALSFVKLAVEGHSDFTIIEADGANTQPLNTSFLQVGSGQRYSLLLNTLTNPNQSTYYIQLETLDRPVVTVSYAILRYTRPFTPPFNSSSSFYPPSSPPLTLGPTDLDFLSYSLLPLSPSPNFPPASAVTRTITVHIHQVSKRIPTIAWTVNGIGWTENTPTEPYLISLYKNDSIEFPSLERAKANEGIDPVTKAFPAEVGEVIEIVIQNEGSDSGGVEAHPWHAHGGHFWDLGSGNGTYNQTANEILLAQRPNGSQPLMRDTTMLYRYESSGVLANNTQSGWRAWRLRVDEPGVWMIHCHVLQHMIMGMQTVWVFGNESEILTKLATPDVTGYLTYGGDVYGNETHAPEVVHFQDMEAFGSEGGEKRAGGW